MRAIGYVVGLAMLSHACGDDASDLDASDASGLDAPLGEDGGPPAEGRIELGTGVATFMALPETGASLDLVHGPQGGWHLVVSARVFGLDPTGFQLSYEMYRPDSGAQINLPSMYTLRRERVLDLGDHFEHLNDICIFDIEGPAEVVGDTVELRLVGTPLEGTPVMDSRLLLVTDDDGI